MSGTTNYIRREARRIKSATAKAKGGFAKGKVFTGRRGRKLKIRA